MRPFRSVEAVEAALAEASTGDDVAAILRTVQRQKKLLGPVNTAHDPKSNRRRIVAALDAAVARVGTVTT